MCLAAALLRRVLAHWIIREQRIEMRLRD